MLHSPVHPGAVLSDVLDDMGISVTKAASDLGISRQMLSGILNGRKPITSDMAVRIGHYIGNGPDVWAKMQTSFDLVESQRNMRDVIANIPKASEARLG
ncbi:MAG TPA: HigA family addiction module antitoxin [Gammaproteobacteria bacterium]|jgi:addiction module HigA family antidote